MVGVLADDGKVSIAAGYKMALPLIALACSLVLAFGTNRAPLADVFSTAASALIEMITWLVLVNVCRMAAIPSIAVFVAGRIIVHIGMLIGEGAGFACLCMGYGSLFVIACIVMVVIVTSVLFADTTFCDTGSEPGGEEGDRDDASFDVRLRGQCGGGIVTGPDTEVRPASVDPVACMSDRYGLTRETEALGLWGFGYGSKYIEEKLCISPATVKTHVRHIYDKVGVRSRPELMVCMEKVSADLLEKID